MNPQDRIDSLDTIGSCVKAYILDLSGDLSDLALTILVNLYNTTDIGKDPTATAPLIARLIGVRIYLTE